MNSENQCGCPTLAPCFWALGWAVSLLAFLLLACSMALAQTASPSTASSSKPTCVPAKYRIVAERTGSGADKSRYALAVDPDSRVLLLLLSQAGKPEEAELLGYEPEIAAGSPIASLLPSERALLTLRRITCPDRWRLWVALTVGLTASADNKPFALNNSLHVFRQQTAPPDTVAGSTGSEEQGSIAALLTEIFPEGAELTVDDINADEASEIAVQYAATDNRFTSLLKLWSVGPDGALHSVALDHLLHDIPATATQADIGLADYRHSEDVLYTESRSPSARGTLIVRRNYAWDDASQSYTLREVVRTQETEVK